MRLGVDRDSDQPLMVEFDQTAWPAKRANKLYHDELGLPVFCWCDAGSWLPRAVFVLLGNTEPRNALFVHVNGNYRERGKQLRWMLGIPLAILAVLIFIRVWHSYYFVTLNDLMENRYGVVSEPMNISQAVGNAVVGYVAWPVGILLCIGLSVAVTPYFADLLTRSRVWAGHEVEFDLRNWVDLTSFEIADAKDIYGSLQNIEPLASASARHFIIRAYFGTEDRDVEVSRSNFNLVAVGHIHQVLTREFIQKRQAYLDRLPPAPAPARSTRAPTAAPGGRAWSGDIPDHL